METAWVILLLASISVAVVAVYAFKKISHPGKIAFHRNRLLARTVELFLYQESLRALGRASGRLWGSLFRYLFALALPILAALVVVLPILILVCPFLADSPIQTGRPFLVEISWIAENGEFDLEGEGVRATAPPVRVPGEGRVVWRCEASQEPECFLRPVSGSHSVRFPVATGNGCRWIIDEWTASGIEAIAPGVVRIDGEKLQFEKLRIDYPEREYRVLGGRFDWLTILSVSSILFSIPVAIFARITL